VSTDIDNAPPDPTRYGRLFGNLIAEAKQMRMANTAVRLDAALPTVEQMNTGMNPCHT